MKGVFGLSTHTNLFEKLEWEYHNLVQEPQNAYHAYNFFVTAWHLLEWKILEDHSARKEMRDKNPILQVCEHLAIGAKHFEPDNPKLESVNETKRNSVWGDGVWAEGAWKEGVWANWLTISLSGDAQKEFGNIVKAHEFARIVMEFWRNEI